MKDREQYQKLRRAPPGNQTPREDPSRQSPGKRGYARPEFDRWTDQELRDQAERLEIPDAARLSREALIDALLEHEIR
jgi:hypothetical protein